MESRRVCCSALVHVSNGENDRGADISVEKFLKAWPPLEADRGCQGSGKHIKDEASSFSSPSECEIVLSGVVIRNLISRG